MESDDSYFVPQPPQPVDPETLVSPPPRHRWWTALAVLVTAGVCVIVLAAVVQLFAIAQAHGISSPELLRDEQALHRALADFAASRLGLAMLLVLPQMAMLTPVLIAAALSPVAFRERLGLVRGHWPIWAWIAGAAATPLVGLISSLVLGQFMEESESLKEMSGIFRQHGTGGFLIPLALMIGATPAICEELLFRGYLQTRFTQSFGPVFGVFVASGMFAAFHFDPVHVLAVFPLGLFLGILSWRSGSLIPAMLAHFVNNVISVVALVIAPEDQADMLSLPTVAMSLTILLTGFLGMMLTIVALVFYRPPSPTAVETVTT